MAANRYELEMFQGETFQLLLNLQDANTNPLPLSNGYSAIMEIKTSYANSLVTESLSTSNGEITLGSNAGIYLLKLPANRTANVYVNLTNGIPPNSQYVYDITLTNNNYNISYKILYGTIKFFGQV